MEITQLLRLGRSIGLKNFSQLKNLTRAIGNEAPFARAHFVLNKNMADEFVKLAEKPMVDANAKRIINIANYYNPKANDPTAKTIYDVVLNRFGKHSGTINVQGKSLTHTDGVYAKIDAKALINDAGGRVYYNATIPSAHMNANVDVAILNKAATKTNNLDVLAKSLQYNSSNGISTLSINPVSANGLRGYMNVQAPTGFFNDITRVSTDYEFMSFDQALNKLLPKK